ncbi:hypothetical protein BDQ17DRAFT_1431067 [Cyathus striatus]|nr:hypothetical protein BDQ17DRAFT_1431067 [Cyathus striatus]
MSSFKLLAVFAFSALSAASAATLPVRQVTSCFPPTPGNYNIISQSMAGELVGVGQTGFLIMENIAPQGNLGVWSLTTADNAGFNIQNVELGRNVTTVHLRESNLDVTLVADAGTPADSYAIECAGGGAYVIKAAVQDEVWTTVPATGEPYESEGYAQVMVVPANGASAQRFFLKQV